MSINGNLIKKDNNYNLSNKNSMFSSNLEKINNKVNKKFKSIDTAREYAFTLHREIIKTSSLSIRAIHRKNFVEAKKLILKAKNQIQDLNKKLGNFPEIYYAGFVQDSQKEYSEAQITFAIIKEKEIPDPDELNVDYAAYLNGLGEATGEMRRYILDSMRSGQDKKCEKLLSIMNEIYYMLTSLDYPDAITRGLRRTTDLVRSILERTRGDLTAYLTQKRLEKALSKKNLSIC